ncbi:MAG: hypothetical protein KatS3mg131_1854 [Candidatus Tectimicrobiota bacterium]|nr:MAG: hypothetical protein KatS3mg131_1854 [Candidatus Tectomicrobia bacterium]
MSDEARTAGVESGEEAARQWEEYLHAETVWDHFLTFSLDALQWTYNVQ